MKIFMTVIAVIATISVISGLAIPAMADQNPPPSGTGQSDSSLTMTDEMTSNRYVDPDEDLGLMFSVMEMRNMPSTGRHDLLIVGVVLGLTIVMLAMAVITGRNLKRHRQI